MTSRQVSAQSAGFSQARVHERFSFPFAVFRIPRFTSKICRNIAKICWKLLETKAYKLFTGNKNNRAASAFKVPEKRGFMSFSLKICPALSAKLPDFFQKSIKIVIVRLDLDLLRRLLFIHAMMSVMKFFEPPSHSKHSLNRSTILHPHSVKKSASPTWTLDI